MRVSLTSNRLPTGKIGFQPPSNRHANYPANRVPTAFQPSSFQPPNTPRRLEPAFRDLGGPSAASTAPPFTLPQPGLRTVIHATLTIVAHGFLYELRSMNL
jgi:hypothetical protein